MKKIYNLIKYSILRFLKMTGGSDPISCCLEFNSCQNGDISGNNINIAQSMNGLSQEEIERRYVVTKYPENIDKIRKYFVTMDDIYSRMNVKVTSDELDKFNSIVREDLILDYNDNDFLESIYFAHIKSFLRDRVLELVGHHLGDDEQLERPRSYEKHLLKSYESKSF